MTLCAQLFTKQKSRQLLDDNRWLSSGSDHHITYSHFTYQCRHKMFQRYTISMLYCELKTITVRCVYNSVPFFMQSES